MRAMASKDSLLGTLARWLGWTVVLGTGVGALISAHRGVTLEEFVVTAPGCASSWLFGEAVAGERCRRG
jgi:hypothetical protein